MLDFGGVNKSLSFFCVFLEKDSSLMKFCVNQDRKRQ